MTNAVWLSEHALAHSTAERQPTTTGSDWGYSNSLSGFLVITTDTHYCNHLDQRKDCFALHALACSFQVRLTADCTTIAQDIFPEEMLVVPTPELHKISEVSTVFRPMMQQRVPQLSCTVRQSGYTETSPETH